MIKIVLLALAMLLSGCATGPKPASVAESAKGDVVSADGETEDIWEAVFRHQFEHNASGQQDKAKVYFLSIQNGREQGADPSDGFMARFAGHKPPVRKSSRCTFSVRGVFDKITNQRGLIFEVGKITRHSPDKVDVEGGYYEAGLSASGNTCTVEQLNGKWTVTKNVMHGISRFDRRPEHLPIVSERYALQAQVDALQKLRAETAAKLDALIPSILDRAFRREL